MRFLRKVSTGLVALSISLVILCYLLVPYSVLAASTNISNKVQTNTPHGFLQQGIAHLQQNNYADAIADFTQAIQDLKVLPQLSVIAV
ncbi:MAG: hypothetical protein HC935_00380 [Pseudanabaena sp. SU_2_4]|nr:hypothetical protein [Pseudanabaena sp. SU_2_4]